MNTSTVLLLLAAAGVIYFATRPPTTVQVSSTSQTLGQVNQIGQTVNSLLGTLGGLFGHGSSSTSSGQGVCPPGETWVPDSSFSGGGFGGGGGYCQ